jgi:hypothetical protein
MPSKKLKSSGIEMAGRLLHQLTLEPVYYMCHKTAATWSDNTPMVIWVKRMTSKQFKIVGRLLQGIARRQLIQHMCPLYDDPDSGQSSSLGDEPS